MAPDKPLSVQIWTDGSTIPSNPGDFGGWGAILVGENGKGEKRMRALSGYIPKPVGEEGVTCNRAEAVAAAEALRRVKFDGTHVTLTTDSMYVFRGIAKIVKWKRILDTHIDLWSTVMTMLHFRKLRVEVIHVDGHDLDVMNEWADELAGNAARSGVGVDEIHTSVPEHLLKRVDKRIARQNGS